MRSSRPIEIPCRDSIPEPTPNNPSSSTSRARPIQTRDSIREPKQNSPSTFLYERNQHDTFIIHIAIHANASPYFRIRADLSSSLLPVTALPKHILRSGIVIEKQLFPDIRYCRRVVFVVVVFHISRVGLLTWQPI